jgi:hypothetical protein
MALAMPAISGSVFFERLYIPINVKAPGAEF